MKKVLSIITLILVLNFVNAISTPTILPCDAASTYDANTGVYTCRIIDGHDSATFGVGAQNPADVLINEIRWPDGSSPLDKVNLNIVENSIIFPNYTNITFSRDKFENISIRASNFIIQSGGKIELQSNTLRIVDTNLKAREITLNAPQLYASVIDLNAKTIALKTTGTSAPKFINLSSTLLNAYLGDGNAVAPNMLISTTGSIKIDQQNWNKAGQIDVIGNNVKITNVNILANKLSIQATENITANQFNARAANEIEISSGKYITLQTPEGIHSDSYVTITGQENVSIRSGAITSKSRYKVVTYANGSAINAKDKNLSPLELNWKNKSGIFIKAGKALYIDNNLISASEAKETLNYEELKHQGGGKETVNVPPDGTTQSEFYSLLPPKQGENKAIQNIKITLPATNANFASNQKRNAIAIKSGATICSFLLTANANNQIQALQLASANENVIYSNTIQNTRGPYSISVNSTSCVFYINNQVTGMYYFSERHALDFATTKVGVSPFGELDYFNAQPSIEYSLGFAGISLIGESGSINSQQGINSSAGIWIKTPSLTTQINRAKVTYSQLLSREDQSTVISCNDDHSLSWLMDPAVISVSGVCPAARNIYIYGQLAIGGANITIGSIKVVQIVNLRTSQIVNYTFNRLTQNWNATFNNAFNENGTFSIVLGGDRQRFNPLNPTLIVEGGRHEITLSIDSTNAQYTTPCPDGQCMTQTITVNAQ